MIAAPATKWSQPSRALRSKSDVLRVAGQALVAGMSVVLPLDRSILRVIVDPDDLVPGGEQMFDEVTRNESGRAGDERLHEGKTPFP